MGGGGRYGPPQQRVGSGLGPAGRGLTQMSENVSKVKGENKPKQNKVAQCNSNNRPRYYSDCLVKNIRIFLSRVMDLEGLS